MKFGELRSIGHNIADSLASGIGLPIGVYLTDVFAEASQSAEGYILVDFLTGTTAGAKPSNSLAEAVLLYRTAFRELCEKHGTDPTVFREVTARYSMDSHGGRIVVAVEDRRGRRSMDEFRGRPGARAKEMDALGRIRPRRTG